MPYSHLLYDDRSDAIQANFETSGGPESWLESIPSFMEMEDAVRAMDESDLAPEHQRTINRMRAALIRAKQERS